MRKNQLKQLKSVIYALEDDYGFHLDLYRKTEVVNLETGRRITTRVKYKIKKVIALPNQMFRDFNYGSLIKIGAPVQPGGLFDLKQRDIIINKKRLPIDFEISINDYIVFNHNRYEIKNILDMEIANYVRLTIKHLEGELPNEVHEETIRQYLIFDDNIDTSSFEQYRKVSDHLRFTHQYAKYIVHNQSIKQTLNFWDGIGEEHGS